MKNQEELQAVSFVTFLNLTTQLMTRYSDASGNMQTTLLQKCIVTLVATLYMYVMVCIFVFVCFCVFA